MHITKEALKLLAMLNNSCKVFGKKKIENSKYIVNLALSGKGVDLESFIRNMPQKSQMYSALGIFARFRALTVIDRTAVFDFFDGTGHAEYCRDQVRMLNLEKKPDRFAEKFVIAHMLLPVTIRALKNKFVAVYKNGRSEVLLEHLIIHPFLGTLPQFSWKKGYVHFATIIDLDVDTDEWEEMLKIQDKVSYLIWAAVRVQHIDYSQFWDVLVWTKKNLKNCGL